MKRLLIVVVVLAVAGGAAYWWSQRGPDLAAHGVKRVDFTVRSASVGTRDEIGLVPNGVPRGRPLLVLLHGRGTSPSWMLTDQLLGALQKEGKKAPAVALLDGGDDSYWHDRAAGDWGHYVMKEAIPQALKVLHADPKRVAIGGISMGGFGALDLARLYPTRFCAVGGHSPALWRTGGETAAGAFDDAADFSRHDLFSSVQNGFRYREPVWIDVGDEDPFFAADHDFAHLVADSGSDVSMHFWSGAHNSEYWLPHMNDYIDFYSNALAAC